jgi:ATP-dependent Clp protease ATP-binding subunit ClpC
VTAKLWIHVRACPDGRFVLTPVDFPELAIYAGDRESGLRTVTNRLGKRLRTVSPAGRTALLDPPAPALETVQVDVPVGAKKNTDTVRITVGIAVLARRTSGGEVIVVRAPAVAGFELAMTSRAEAPAAAARELGKYLRQWPLDSVLAADEIGDVILEALELPFPPVSKPLEEGDDEEAILEQCGDNLSAAALEQRLSRLDRRDELVERVLAALASAERSSVMLVGPRDVGKTALIHEVATRLSAGDVPAPLSGRELWRVSANELIAGAQYIGMWQDRARRLVDAVRADDVIVAMGDPAGIVDAGRWSKSENNLARFLRTYVESGEITLICECTPEVYAAAHKKEASFVDAFHRVDVPEPTPETAREILTDASRRIEARQQLTFEPSALSEALALTRRFEPYRGLPGKAVRLLEDTVQRRARDGDAPVTREDVVAAFTARTGLPTSLLSDEMPMELSDVREFFEARVLGQTEPVDAMVELVSVLKAGLNDPSKPLGTFFFVGPTGVGKTELAKALAEFLFGSRERLLRFDMGEHTTADAVQRLIGTSWQSDGEGELTRRVREQPFCVVLLDEIEKAHPPVFDVLLSALGEGRLTDANGRTADFRNAIVVMTSNLGSRRAQSSAIGFGNHGVNEIERLRRHYVDQAERFFRPEFFNRIDRIVVFDPLDEGTVRQIARREVGRLLFREGIARRRLLVEIDEPALDALARRGFDPEYGARPLQREIERAVIRPLARIIVQQRPRPEDLIRVRAAGDDVAVDLERVKVPKLPKSPRVRRERAAEATIAKVAESVRDLTERIEAEEATPVVESLRAEAARLIAETHEPTFWDQPESARSVLKRIYQLEYVLDRLEALRRRAAGLGEMAQQMRIKRDKRRLPELRQALEEVEDSLLVTRLELEGAVDATGAPAAIRVVPVGAHSREWASELLAMYMAWAERTGRDVRRSDDPAENSATIEGFSSFDLLAGESGLHRRVLPDRDVLLARVVVVQANGGEAADADAGNGGTVVRVYEQGRRQSVRDPRTGVRVGNVPAVLRDGRIDAFLRGYLRDARRSLAGDAHSA